MKENLVIVESPAKAKTIEKFLGEDYCVMSSYGHIRDLKKKSFSVDEKTFLPQYEIPADKARVVAQLRKQMQESGTVWLASDEDREGEAISWHLSEVLGLDPKHTRRIVFHEITKPAILEAIKNPREIDLNLVNAQQARRVLDRIVGFKLSPVLWRKVKPALSAGRVQSVAVRLIVEREREIQQFKGEDNFRITAVFTDAQGCEVKAELNHRFATEAQAEEFLRKCIGAKFTVQDVSVKPQKRTPAPPFTTSTLQQEAAHKLGFTVAQTMMVAQHLYESGRITYMRTDSVNLSNLCLGACSTMIAGSMGDNYVKTRQYHTSSKGAQEAHEAIRPTYVENQQIEGTQQEKRLYDLIWKRTVASQMADAEVEKTQVNISVEGTDEYFVAQGEVIKFDGFLRVYKETEGENESATEAEATLPALTVGEALNRSTLTATQRFAQHPVRYNEASLVRKLEELGIGRPSTYAATITTIQQREYVAKGDKAGDELAHSQNKTTVGAERGKLMPTDIGIVVNDFLQENFPTIMDYNFTADIEKDFDEIAEGHKEWTGVIKQFYKEFEPLVEQSINARGEKRVGERELGVDPKSGLPISVKIGRFGPVVQMGKTDDNVKPRFAQLKKGQTMESITLEEALKLLQLPHKLGEYQGKPVTVGAGKYGPYVAHDGTYVSIPKDIDPLKITFEQAVILVHRKQIEEEERHLKRFEEDASMEILNGRYGPYIVLDGVNYRIPKGQQAKAASLTYEECKAIIEAQGEKAQNAKGAHRKGTRKTQA